MTRRHSFNGSFPAQLGKLCPGPRWGAYSVPPNPLVGKGLAAPSQRTPPA